MSEIDEKLRRLREIQIDIITRINSERQSLADKYTRLMEIRNMMANISRQSPLSQFLMIGVFGELISEHDRLVSEIMRERSIIENLTLELKRIQDDIIRLQSMRGMITVRIPKTAEEFARREKEINWLLNELRNIEMGKIPDGKYRIRIINRLRELGYPI